MSRRPGWPERAACGSLSATCCPAPSRHALVTASLDIGNLVLTLAGAVLPRPRAVRARPRARRRRGPQPQLTAPGVVGSGDSRASRVAGARARRQHRRRRRPQPHRTGVGRHDRPSRQAARVDDRHRSCRADRGDLLPAAHLPAGPGHTPMLGAQASAGPSPQQRHALGLDQPDHCPVLVTTSSGLLHGDLGTSYRTRPAGQHRPRQRSSRRRCELAAAGLLIALVLACRLRFRTDPAVARRGHLPRSSC